MNLLIEKIKEVRLRTGANLIQCKDALMKFDLDIERAINSLKCFSNNYVQKKSVTEIKNGAVFCAISDNFSCAVLVELLCETDFVAKNNDFLKILKDLSYFCLNYTIRTCDELIKCDSTKFSQFGHKDFKSFLNFLILKFGENIKINTISYFSVKNDNTIIGSYVHYRNAIPTVCSIIFLECAQRNITLANELAIHVVANNCKVISMSDFSHEYIEKEKVNFVADFLNKNFYNSTDNDINFFLRKKFKNEVLLYQDFFFDLTKDVMTVLKENKCQILDFKVLKVSDNLK